MQRPAFATGLLAALSLVLCFDAQATLIDRGNGLIYDTALNVTWASDADLFNTMSKADPGLVARIIKDVRTVSDGPTTHTLTTNDFPDPSSNHGGVLSWWGAMAFAQDVVYAGFDDWRLPVSKQPDASCRQQGFNGNMAFSFGATCTGSELGELFYDELGGRTDMDLKLVHNGNYALFSDITDTYWTGTPFTTPDAPSSTDQAWYFDVSSGYQEAGALDPTVRPFDAYAWIVRTGDVAAVGQPGGGGANAVPEPETFALMLGGLGLIGLGRRRRPPRAHPGRAKRIVAGMAGVLAAGLVSGAAQASLVDNGGGLIYDTDRNITWAQDVSLLTTMYNADPNLVAKIVAAVPTVSGNGQTHTLTTADFFDFVFGTANRVEGSWWGDMAFAQYVTLGSTTGWRLPTTLTPDPSCSINGGPAASPLTGCNGSEMGHIYYDEFGSHFLTGMPGNPDRYALFNNFQSAAGFWSGTTYDSTFFPDAAFFFTPDGRQGLLSDLSAYATPWIVHDGDIGAAAQPGGGDGGTVPEPALVSLMFAGLGAIGIAGRRRGLRHHRRELA